MASDASTKIEARGSAQIDIVRGSKNKTVTLENTLFVPNLRTNLVSVSKITDRGHEVTFKRNRAVVKDANGSIRMVADRVGDLYYMRIAEKAHAVIEDRSQQGLKLWHSRMGHVNVRDLVTMTRKKLVTGVNIGRVNSLPPCSTCMKGKLYALPFTNSSIKSSKRLHIVHADVCGPMRERSKGRALYFVTFTDDYTRWCEVHFIKRKNEVLKAFKEFKAHAENLCGEKIKFLQSDNGREFCNGEFDAYLQREGIRRRLTTPYTPQQNGVAERKNRTLIDMARCLLFQTNLQTSFWAEAVHTANYIRNRCTTRSINGKTPYEAWFGKTPDLRHLRIIGTKAYVLNKNTTKGKFDARSKEGILVGYSEVSKGYRIWINSESRIVTTRDVKFDIELDSERIAVDEDLDDFMVNTVVNTRGQTVPIEEETEINDMPGEDTQENIQAPHVRKSRMRGRPRVIRTGNRGRPRKEYRLKDAENVDRHVRQRDEMSDASSDVEVNVPTEGEEESDEEDDVFFEANLVMETANTAEVELREAISGPCSNEWMDATVTEFRNILAHNTWRMVKRPKDRAVISSRLVLNTKIEPDGKMCRRKARLVARGFSQRPGIDFDQTYAPVARLESLRLMVALATKNKIRIHQLDIVSAYLNGRLEEDIFMEKPEMLEEILKEIIRRDGKNSVSGKKAMEMLHDVEHGNNVCLLKKALYGLRQAWRQWHKRLDTVIRKLGLKPTNADPCVYVSTRGKTKLMVLIYVDDILVCSQEENWIKEFNQGLEKEFDVKDIGLARYCLGIEITQKPGEIRLSQQRYVDEILKRFNMESCNPVTTPGEVGGQKVNKTVTKANDEVQNPEVPYRELVGALMYLAIATRPDIAYMASYLAQFNNDYIQKQWGMAKRVLRYIKGTSNFALCFREHDHALMGYTDADWGNCTIDRRSYTGYAFILCQAAVSWKAQKQRTVALSSTEAEYMALAETAREAAHLRNLLKELGELQHGGTVIFCDNSGARLLSENPVYHARTKHIHIRHHYVQEAVASGRVVVEPLPTAEMTADILTKALPRQKHFQCTNWLGLE